MRPGTVGQPFPEAEREIREPWWMAPVGFLVVGAFGGAAVVLWFAERLA